MKIRLPAFLMTPVFGALAMNPTAGSADDLSATSSWAAINVSMKVPCYRGYDIQIAEAYIGEAAVYVVSYIIHPRKGAGCSEGISTVRDDVGLKVPKKLPIRHLILGRDWCWGDPGEDAGYQYPRSRSEIQPILDSSQRIFDAKVLTNDRLRDNARRVGCRDNENDT